MSKFTIILNDGERLDNLTLNGSMFVSQTEVALEQLNEEALAEVTIIETDDAGNTTETHMENAVCDNVLQWPEGWLFNIREPSAMEAQITAMQAQIDIQTECILEMSEIIYG